MKIEFLYFSGCPDSEPTLENLKVALSEMNIDVDPSLVDVDPAAFKRPFLGSPSIVVNGIDLYTLSHSDAFEFACRTFDIGGEKTGALSTAFVRGRIERIINGI